MKVAIPVAGGVLNAHFGHCEAFTVFEFDCEKGVVIDTFEISAPPHEPGLLPRFLSEKGIDVVIVGGMGNYAQQLFGERGITVIAGAPSLPAKEVMDKYLAGTLTYGKNLCDH